MRTLVAAGARRRWRRRFRARRPSGL
jgi:hypothetical protein